MPETTDILMITYNRPQYTRLALTRLLETCDESMRVWLWHNGEHAETLEVVKSLANHPRVHECHHSEENKKLREPTNWLWQNAKGEYLSKVDDDCLMPGGWAQTLRKAHEDVPELGIIGCWRFLPEDFVPEAANKKIRTLGGGHRILENHWVEGSGYLMKRTCMEAQGLLRGPGRWRPAQSFSHYCFKVAMAGWTNGWYFPFLYQEHMDDPRVPHSLLRSDQDLLKYLPLSAARNDIATLDQWASQLKRSARFVQEASIDRTRYVGWRYFTSAVQGWLVRQCGWDKW